jgi:hypothetical protein
LGFTTSVWDGEGIAALEATGGDVRSALEAGLRAALVLAKGATTMPSGAGRSAPVRGEGDDLGTLFAALVEDLLDQVAHFGPGLDDVVLDGLLRRDDGGYVAWGYVSGNLETAPRDDVPELFGAPIVTDDDQGFVVRATLRR